MFNFASKARPYFGAVVLTTALLVAGGVWSATRMPSGVYPEVTFPRIAVVARKPGLDLRTMELQVTQPLEQAVSTILGVTQVRSKTIRGGSELSIDFAPGTDMRHAEQLTWNRIGAARSQLPADLELTVEQMTPSVFPILSVVLTGGDNPAQLRDYAYYQLAPAIKNVPDVLYCNVAGGDLREIEVEVRPDDLLAAGLSAADLADRIGKEHRLQPVGRIEHGPFAFQVMVNTQAEKAREIEELVVSTKGGQQLRVRDVADVKLAHQDRVASVGFEGKEAVVLTVFRRLGGNTVNVSNDVRELLAKQPFPGSIKARVAYDQARFVDNAVNNVRDAILIGGAFSVLILLAFLRSWRATLISALAIPITLAITFLILYFLHNLGETLGLTALAGLTTLNLMSLGGLAVAIGLIIDDTVVVIENIARHLEPGAAKAAGVDPVDAASREITGAVVGSTLTTVLVFLPLAFITGVYGQFFASLSWSLSIAVLVSMVISLTLIPVCAAKFLAGRPMPPPGPVYRGLAYLYELVLSAALRVPLLSLVLSLAAVGVGVVLYTGVPDWKAEREEGKPPPPKLVKGLETGLLPNMDEGAFVLDYFAPTGTPLERTEEMARLIEHLLSENPDIENYVRRSGAELGLFATETNRGDIQVVLRPAEDSPIIWENGRPRARKPERPKFSELEKELARMGMKPDEERAKEYVHARYRRRPLKAVMEEIEDEVKEHFGEHQLKVELIQIMEDELNDLSGANRPIEVKLFGSDHDELRKRAETVAEALEKRGKGRGMKEVDSHVLGGNPDLMIEVDGVRASRLGLTAEEVERQVRVMYLGHVATQVRESAQRITDVRVRYPDRSRFGAGRFDPDVVRNQWLLLPEGVAGAPPSGPGAVPLPPVLARAVPLSAVATVKPTRTPDVYWRENQQPAIFVTAEHNEKEAGLGSVVADIRETMKDLSDKGEIPRDYDLGGHYVRQQEAFHSLLIVMIVAVLLVFILLAFQFRSVLLPLLIFLTQPLSLVSGLFALWLTDTPLNVSSYMGAILLIGLDVKNGILLVEYIQQLRRQGMALRPALILAGRTRFRPILMTSLAAILGLFPLALGIGPGAQMQQPLAIMVIGGLTANMLFTRLIIPVGYLVLDRLRPGRDEAAAKEKVLLAIPSH